MQKTQRQLQKEQTRSCILEAAFREYGNNGIVSSRMNDIAKAAGVSHGTVFAHFDTQEALISAVIEEFGEKICRRTHELAQGSGSVREVLAAHLAGITEFEAFYTSLITEIRYLPQVAKDTLVMVQSAISHHLSQAAQREFLAGTICTMPLHLLFNTWLGLIHYYLSNSDWFATDGSVLESLGAELLDHYINIISKSQMSDKEAECR